MARLGISANTRAFLDGKEINLYQGWQDVGIRAVFEDAIQPSLDIENVTFVNAEAQQIRDYIIGGMNGTTPGIFEGMLFKEEVYNSLKTITSFNGMLDLSDGYKDYYPQPKVECKLVKLDGQNNLKNRLESLTYGYLEELGKVSASDYTEVNYQVIKTSTLIEILVANITLFLLVKELQESIRDTAKAIADAAGHFAGGLPGPIAAAIFAVAVAAIQILYLVIIVASIIKLIQTLINTILPPLRQCQTIKFKRALEVASSHLGYNLISPISELDNLYFLPSNINLDILDGNTGLFKKVRGTEKGIPNSQDYGYLTSEMFELAETLFTADKAIFGNELHLRAKNDPFWIKKSTWVAPSHIPPTTEYNTNELKADVVTTFQTDISDEWTIDNFTGTNYEIITDAISTRNEKAKTLKGQQTYNYSSALGNVKEELTALESIIFELAKFADKITKVFTGKGNLSGKIEKRKNVLKISRNDYSKPKLLWLQGGKVPPNHRELFSAKAMHEKYGSWNSFVFNGQKVIHNNCTVPFGMEDFVKLTENSYFTTPNGEVAKATELFWVKGKDKAELSYYIRKPYTKNLKETKLEPNGS